MLSALSVVGLARALNPGWTPSGRPVYFVPVVTALLAGQLLIYLVQETFELASLGTAPSAALLAWGVAGQAPIALLAAAAVRWLSQCFEPALRALGVEFSNAFAAAPDASEAVPSATGAVLVSARVALLPALRAPPPSLTR
jgi:hypothetical protein